MKYDREQQKQKQQKKEKIHYNGDDTVITKITQEYSLEDEELECNLIDDKDDKYDNNIVMIPTQVLFRMHDETLNLKWKCKCKWKQK